MGVGEGAGYGVGSGVLKCILITLNIIFGLIGFILLAVGIFIFAGLNKVANDLLGDQLKSLDNLMSGLNLQSYTSLDGQTIDFAALMSSLAIPFIIFGLFLFACSFFGCCGACCSSKILLVIYIIICSVVLLAQIILIGLFFTNKLDGQIRNQIQGRIDNDYEGIDDYGAWSLMFNFLMTKYKCCGIDNHKDFDEATKWKKTRTFEYTTGGTKYNRTVTLLTPMACCKFTGTFPDLGEPVDDECAYKALNDPSINNYDTGCWGEVTTELKKFKNQGLGGLIGVILVQAIIITITAVLLCLMDKDKIGVV